MFIITLLFKNQKKIIKNEFKIVFKGFNIN